jgi:hypothetical protein
MGLGADPVPPEQDEGVGHPAKRVSCCSGGEEEKGRGARGWLHLWNNKQKTTLEAYFQY